MPFALPLLLALPNFDATRLLSDLRAAVKQPNGLKPFLFSEADGKYLLALARQRPTLSVHIIPVPPGWKSNGSYWAIFSRPQSVEGLHDAVYEVRPDLRLGKEIPEWMDPAGAKVSKVVSSVRLDVPAKMATVNTTLRLDGTGAKRAPVFRLNDCYRVNSASMNGKIVHVIEADGIPSPQPGQVLRAGGLIVPWTTTAAKEVSFTYAGTPAGEDRFTEKLAYLTGWWVPSLGRLPAPTEVTIRGPRDWQLRSEGTLQSTRPVGSGEVEVGYKCDIPITFPKVVAGQYTLAAETKDNLGRSFKAWQFEPIDKKRAETDARKMAEAAAFYDRTLIKFPFPGYECFDGEQFYGIESYSYTLLAPSITSRYVTHEMGHTYFGGIGPCTYIKDTWNEGVTTYVDDIVSGRNIDNPFDQALEDIGDGRALSQMNFDSGNSNASYWRGAAVMKMLEQEIGQPKVLEGLRRVLRDRRGKDTVWADLLPCFDAASGQKLKWFWDQWILNGKFPTVKISAIAKPAPTGDSPQGQLVTVTLEQSGTAKPFRMRLPVTATNGELEYSKSVVFDKPKMTFQIVCETPVRFVVVRPKDFALIAPAQYELPRP